MIWKEHTNTIYTRGFAILFLLLMTACVFAANFPLQILQPQAGLTTTNRFYKAYPGLKYDVSMAVVGGDYPYTYALTQAPSGMTINSNTGEIAWNSPTASITPYTVTASVTDASANTATVTWNVTVTTSGFLFVNATTGHYSASNGGTGTGTINNPFKSLLDVYGGNVYNSKYTSTYAGDFVYWESGTYPVNSSTAFEENSNRIPFVSNDKPQVWLAYPGDKPVFDLTDYIAIYSGGSNTYFDGLTFDLTTSKRGKGIQIDSTGNNVTFIRNTLHGIVNGYIGGNNSFLFIAHAAMGSDWAFLDNDFYDANQAYGLLGYETQDVLVAGNTVHQITGIGIGPKMTTQMWFIRGNTFYDNTGNSINVLYYASSGVLSGNIEIYYNLILNGGGSLLLNNQQEVDGLPIYVYRNTIISDVEVLTPTSTNGPFYFDHNVIVNSDTTANKMTEKYVSDPSAIVITNDLVGSLTDSIVDAGGNLTGPYQPDLNIDGYQMTTPASAPTNLH